MLWWQLSDMLEVHFKLQMTSLSQQHILGFATKLYNYVPIKKDICN
jgi:hypothetical protein